LDAIEKAKSEAKKPTLICCKTVIGWGAPNKEGTGDVHGAPLGDDEIKLVREKINWPHAPFDIPNEIYNSWNADQSGASQEAQWQEKFNAYQAKHPELAKEFVRRASGELPENWQAEAQKVVQAAIDEKQTVATRKASQLALDGFAKHLPEIVGGSADLTPSNNTWWSGSKDISTGDASGNYIRYGVREFGMAAINSGIALHGGFIPYSATFLVFSDYSRNALRMSALMKLRNIFIFTHDSIGLGEDGPTHQAVEQTSTLRMIPNMSLWRTADTVESAVAWKHAIERSDGPSCLIFSRQNLPYLERTKEQAENVAKGGYVLHDCEGSPELIMIAAGSEVSITLSAAQQLTLLGKRVRVVSMPSTDVFDQQEDDYKETVLPAAVTNRLAVEAGVSGYWYKYVGIDTFGASAPGGVAMQHFGFSEANIVMNANEMLG